ncbi:glycoside hydrolase family 28 protein [Nibricoccus sp. IMCC34717]|uniref:glycoside hydrolase family 28 protein n=1 Tax=Nibricoccus sp. IMCC34717 TaxID=3034021 RepID=UPI00384EF4F7
MFIPKNMKLLTLIGLLAASVSSSAIAAQFDITAFGAKSNSPELATAAINSAIAKANAAGGGVVIVPSGRYVSGTIRFLSNVELRLEPGAVIVGSDKLEDYPPVTGALFVEGYTRYGLFRLEDVRNVSITGTGEINGNGTRFINGADKPHIANDFDRKYTRQGEKYLPEGQPVEDGPGSHGERPGALVLAERCENIRITQVTFRDSPDWTVRLSGCDDAVVSGITIRNNLLMPGSDGVHTTSSRNVRISDCDISVGDDAVIVSGFGDAPLPGAPIPEGYVGNRSGFAENVTVTNCVLVSRSSGVRIGYGEHPIRNVVLSNLVIRDSNRGIGIFARAHSQIENILCSGVIIQTRLPSGHWWGKGEPIHISALSDDAQDPGGTIRNVRISNVIADAEAGVVIFGNRRDAVRDIELDSVQLTIRTGKNSAAYGGNLDFRPADTLAHALYKRDLPAIYAECVTGLSLRDCEVRWGVDLPEFYTHALEVSDFIGLRIDGFRGKAAPGKSLPAIQLTDGRRIEIERLHDLSADEVSRTRAN